MQHAAAYEWRGRIFLHADSKTPHGLWVLSQPILAADPRDPPELGRAILLALAGSKEGAPHPSIWEDASDPLLKFAGAKSRSTFYGSAQCVNIKFQSGRVTFTPYRYLGAKDGFEAIKGKDRTSSPDNAELGTALLAAFQDAE